MRRRLAAAWQRGRRCDVQRLEDVLGAFVRDIRVKTGAPPAVVKLPWSYMQALWREARAQNRFAHEVIYGAAKCEGTVFLERHAVALTGGGMVIGVLDLPPVEAS